MNIRSVIRNIIQESKFIEKNDSVMQDEAIIRNTITSFSLAPHGYTILSVVKEETGFLDELVYTITMQHTRPDFKKYVNQLSARGGKFATIYGDTPTSKTMITRWLTGFRDGADIDARQKSAAIKVAQLAGLDALTPLIQLLESTYNCTCVANFTGAKTKNKGLSFFEFYVFDNSNRVGSAPPEAPEPPTEIPVDDEVVEIPTEPVKPPKKSKKSRKPRKKKKLKLTRKQKRAGYNRINSRGDIRHVLDQNELDTIENHIVRIITKEEYKSVQDLSPEDAHDMYQEVKRWEGYSAEAKDPETGIQYFRVVDDYHEEKLPRLVFYGGKIYTGARVKSRSMMAQYMSINSDLVRVTRTGSSGDYMQDPDFGHDDLEDYTPPKLGGKEAKDVRRYVQQTRSGDELIIYAKITPHKNPYTAKISPRTGTIDLYVFQLDRNFQEES